MKKNDELKRENKERTRKEKIKKWNNKRSKR